MEHGRCDCSIRAVVAVSVAAFYFYSPEVQNEVTRRTSSSHWAFRRRFGKNGLAVSSCWMLDLSRVFFLSHREELNLGCRRGATE
jgi:hypothetical protein